MANALTVRELIEDLQEFDGDSEVYMSHYDDVYEVSYLCYDDSTLYLSYCDGDDEPYSVSGLLNELSDYDEDMDVQARIELEEDGGLSYYDVDPSGGYLDEDDDYVIDLL